MSATSGPGSERMESGARSASGLRDSSFALWDEGRSPRWRAPKMLSRTSTAGRHMWGPAGRLLGILRRLEERPQEVHNPKAQCKYEDEAPDNTQETDETHHHGNKNRLTQKGGSDSHTDERYLTLSATQRWRPNAPSCGEVSPNYCSAGDFPAP